MENHPSDEIGNVIARVIDDKDYSNSKRHMGPLPIDSLQHGVELQTVA
jgi:hypothetical protein